MKAQAPPVSIGSENKLPPAVEMERQLDRAQVRTADVLHEFRDNITWDADGRHFTADISSEKNRAKFKEMRKRYRETAVEVQHKKSGLMNYVDMTTPAGERRQISEKIAEQVGRAKGFREAGGLSRVGVRRHRLDERQFCPDCGSRWTWCECDA
jgi:hypothetical protein